MDKAYFINLTNKLYRLTLLFPKKEPLRYKMRELTDEILAGLILQINLTEDGPLLKLKKGGDLNTKLEILDCFLEIAGAQNWVSLKDVLEIKREYVKIKEELEADENLEKTLMLFPNIGSPASNKSNNDSLPKVVAANFSGQAVRQERILEMLKEKGKAQVWELKKIFPEVTKRTLRRDFEYLLKQGLVERIGERNETFYQVRG